MGLEWVPGAGTHRGRDAAAAAANALLRVLDDLGLLPRLLLLRLLLLRLLLLRLLDLLRLPLLCLLDLILDFLKPIPAKAGEETDSTY